MKNKLETKKSKLKKFQALNETVQIRPEVVSERKFKNAIAANTSKEKEAMGKILSIGALVEVDLKIGDKVVYNPHMINHEMKEDGGTTILINSKAIFGKFI